MGFVVQADGGASTPGANAYITVAFFKGYHEDRGNALPASPAPADADIEKAIIRATDYLDGRFRFVGRRVYGRDQSTEWPRTNAYDIDRRYVNGIPDEIKEATAEYALRALTGALNPDPERDASGAVIVSKSEQVGPISESVTFAAGGAFVMPKYPAADSKLRRTGLVQSGGDVIRA